MEYSLREMVLAEGGISLCKHHIHNVIEVIPKITCVTVPVNARFWSNLFFDNNFSVPDVKTGQNG